MSGEAVYSQIDINVDSTVFAIGSNTLLRSTDFGNNWNVLFDYYNETNGLTHDFLGDVYIIRNDGMGGRVLKSENNGNSWYTVLNSAEELSVINYSKDGRLVCGTGSNAKIYISFDAGDSWNTKTIPTAANQTIGSIAFLPDSIIFLSTAGDGIFKSSDNGITWLKILENSDANIITEDSNKVFIVSDYDFFSSIDSGATWKHILFDKYLTNISFDNNKDILISSQKGLFKIPKGTDSVSYIGITDEIRDVKVIGEKIFAAGHFIYKYDPDVHPYMGKNYYPMNIGNQWEYYETKWTWQRNPPYQYGISSIHITKDTLIGDKKFYFFDNLYHRYDSLSNKLYIFNTESGEERIEMDFNLIESDSLNGDQIVMGFERLFNKYFSFKGLYHEYHDLISSGSSETDFAENLGKIFSGSEGRAHGGFYGYQTRELIRCKLIYPDSIVLYSNSFAPQITIVPIDTITNFSINLNFTVNHYYTHLSYPAEYFNYIDTVLLLSYYSKGDSIVARPDEIIFNEPQTINYNIETVLDSVLLKQGYSFFYKISAKDKGILPHYSFSPDSGYYRADYYKITGIRDTRLVTYFSLSQNYPNPFNPITKIHYQLPKRSTVRIKVYDILGKEIALLVNEEKAAGEYSIEFDGSVFASGVYFYSIDAGEFRLVRKMILMK